MGSGMTAAADRAVAAVLAEAKRYLHVREIPVGSNRSIEIDYWIKESGLDPRGSFPWCAAFFGQIGRQALGAAWPCPRVALVQAIVDWARKSPPTWQPGSPAPGDGFVVWHAGLGRYAHIGFVTDVLPQASGAVRIRTIEGNANPAGGREGYGVFALERATSDQISYVRWTVALAA